MARPRKLYTLTELSSRTGISLPTLQRYKKLHQGRIPAVGVGRKQRFPKEALAVIEEIRKENLAKRGRPRKSAAKVTAKAKSKGAVKKRRTAKKAVKKTTRRPRAATRKKAAAKMTPAHATRGHLLTLTEIAKITGISYPTLSRYVKLFLDKIPHVGEGRRRRFPRRAVAAFEKLRAGSRRGRRPKAASKAGGASRRAAAVDTALSRRIKELEKAQQEISKRLQSVIHQLKKPLKLTIRN